MNLTSTFNLLIFLLLLALFPISSTISTGMTLTDCIDIDNHSALKFEHLSIPGHYKDHIDRVLIPHGLILDRVEKLAQDIAAVVDSDLIACCILKGGFLFFSDLIKAIKKQTNANQTSIPLQLEFIKVQSYQNTSQGEVKVNLSQTDLEALRGKHVLLVEDLIDTGRTMKKLLSVLAQYQPRKVHVATLLWKRTGRNKEGYTPDFVGFTIPDEFIVGYALDYNEHFRDLDHICVINEAGKQKYSIDVPVSPVPSEPDQE